MSLQNTNLIIVGSQLPATFKGDPNALFAEMIRRMKIVSPSGTTFFVISDSEPAGNQGPWLKGGTQWWVFSTTLKRYVPLDITASEKLWYQVGSETPTTNNPPLWLKTTSGTTGAAPDFGNPFAWYLNDGTTWKQFPVIITDGAITRAQLDPKANFFGTASGTDAYTLSFATPSAAFSYGNGSTEAFAGYVKFANANTGASTLAINGGAVAGLKKDVSADLAAGEILAGAVHLVVFDGTNFQLLSRIADTTVTPGPIGGVAVSFGLKITNDAGTPDEVLNVTADAVLLQNAAGNTIQSNAVIVNPDITVSGVGGLDTGSVMASTWYFVWLISDGAGNTNAVYSLSAVNPTVPAAYTFKALLGAVQTDGTSDLSKIFQTDRRVSIEATDIAFVGTGMQNFSTAIPTISKTVFGSTFPTGGPNASGVAGMAGDANFVGEIVFRLSVVAGVNTVYGGYFEVCLITSQSVYVALAGVGATFKIAGYTI